MFKRAMGTAVRGCQLLISPEEEVVPPRLPFVFCAPLNILMAANCCNCSQAILWEPHSLALPEMSS